MHVHLVGLEVVELLPDGGLVLGGQPCPGLVRPSVVLVAGGHLDVVVEFDDLGRNICTLSASRDGEIPLPFSS